MTINFSNIYIKEKAVVGGPYIKDGPIKKYLDYSYNDFYDKEKTFEDAEIKELNRCIDILLNKENIEPSKIDLVLSSDLSNELMISNIVNERLGLPYLGIYNACASYTEELILGACLLKNKNIKNILVTTSSHNLTAERQYRFPIEYGSIKKDYQTFTVTSATSTLLTKKKTNIKIESATIGTVVNLGIKDSSDLGSAMAPAAAKTLYEHLKDTERDINYYDLILTGDLGKYGKEIFKEYMKEEFNIKLNNYNDSAVLVYDMKNKDVLAGGSGVSCLPTYFLTKVYDDMLSGKIKRVLLLATGSLHSTTLVNQKRSIPCICHAVSVEAL